MRLTSGHLLINEKVLAGKAAVCLPFDAGKRPIGAARAQQGHNDPQSLPSIASRSDYSPSLHRGAWSPQHPHAGASRRLASHACQARTPVLGLPWTHSNARAALMGSCRRSVGAFIPRRGAGGRRGADCHAPARMRGVQIRRGKNSKSHVYRSK